MVSKSRGVNTYCEKLGRKYYGLNDEAILNLKTNTDLKKLLYETKNYKRIKRLTKEHHNNKRYAWLNLHSVFYRGTLEIRLHNGTIDAQKIKNWFNIHLTILEFLKGIKNPETIYNLPKNEKFFLSLFDEETQKYIKNRWVKFENDDGVSD